MITYKDILKAHKLLISEQSKPYITIEQFKQYFQKDKNERTKNIQRPKAGNTKHD